MRQKHHVLFLVLCVLGITSCAQSSGKFGTGSVVDSVEGGQGGAGCQSYSETMTRVVADALINKKGLPDSSDVRKDLSVQLASREGGDQLAENVAEAYRLLAEETKQKLNLKTDQELLEAIMALEIGDRTTPEKQELRTKLDQTYARVFSSARVSGLSCSDNGGSGGGTPPSKSGLNPAVRGAFKVMATTTQSCRAIRLPAMTASTPSVDEKAITILHPGHPDGIGQRRVVADAALFTATSYYLQGGIEQGSGCYNTQQNPLIYDYGGKPFTQSAVDAPLDYFHNAGSGTTALGTDCSGYVFSSLASAGMRLTAGKKVTAAMVQGVSARLFMSPASNGWTCIAPVASNDQQTIRNGDILASGGHVVILNNVGADPFGVARFTSISQCTMGNISKANFDFEVMQSSPIKGAIGINRIRAADYYASGETDMATALLQYGVAACKARFGQPSTVLPSTARIVRHKLTPDCMDREVPLEKEACVQSCINTL